jgi:hypothetical protein
MSCKITSLSSGWEREKLEGCFDDGKEEEVAVGDGAVWNLGYEYCPCVGWEKGDEEERVCDACWSGVAARELVSECRESASCSKLYPNPEGWISSEADLTDDEEEAPDVQCIAGEARLGKL